MPIWSKESRKIYARRIQGFWFEFRRTRIGLAGLLLIVVFTSVAILAPWLTPYDPILSKRLADSFAMPRWVTAFPQYKNMPPTIDSSLVWSTKQEVSFLETGAEIRINYVGGEVKPIAIQVNSSFPYEYDPPKSFILKFTLDTKNQKDLAYTITMILIGPTGNKTDISPFWPIRGEIDTHRLIEIQSTEYNWMASRGFEPGVDNVAQEVLATTGTYTIALNINLYPTSSTSTVDLSIKEGVLNILGQVHGILGCDNEGRDIFSQMVYGSRISLAIGLLAAVVSTVLGVAIGVMAGYLGGLVDEITMRVVDILLCLPVLPLLLALIFLFGPNVFYIIILIAIFGWQGLSRVIRSQILSMRETSFVECARASGASKAYIMVKHLMPNVLPIAFATLVLSVPGAILTEASLSFLGFGDPRAPTWGKMLQSAFGFGAFTSMAWWWILPPGLAIMFVCLAFVFIGHAVDNIVNPKLRMRR